MTYSGGGRSAGTLGGVSFYCAVLSYAPMGGGGGGVIHASMPAELPPKECHN